MKKPILLVFFFSFLIVVVYAVKEALTIPEDLFVEQVKTEENAEAPWQKIQKTKNGVVAVETTEKEVKKYKLAAKPAPKREMANTSKHYRFGRKLIGQETEKYSSSDKNLVMVNNINPKWVNKLGKELLRFQRNDTKVFVKKMDSIIKIQNGKGRYLELVLVSFNKNKSRNSFNAFIDSSNGTIVSTWNRTIHENFRNKQLTFSPDN